MNISRTTTLGSTTTMLDYIASAEARYYDLMQTASSGKKVAEPSDDPAASKTILNINTKLSQLSAYTQNMKVAKSELNTLDGALASLTDLIDNANDLATQAANGTYNGGDLSNIKTQIDQILQSVLDISNTNYSGKFIFSGSAVGTQTYTTTKDVDGNITGIDYQGSDTTTDAYKRYVTISDGVTVSINANGESVFGSYTAAVEDDPATVGVDESQPEVATGLVGTLMQLSNALGANDKVAVKATLDKFDTCLDTVSAVRTKFASVASRFDITQDSIDTTVTNLKSYRSSLQDADLAEVATNLAAQEVAMQATYAATSKLLSGQTLLDYI